MCLISSLAASPLPSVQKCNVSTDLSHEQDQRLREDQPGAGQGLGVVTWEEKVEGRLDTSQWPHSGLATQSLQLFSRSTDLGLGAKTPGLLEEVWSYRRGHDRHEAR